MEIKTIVKDEQYLFNFAFCGGVAGFKEKINKLAKLAEEEKWCFEENDDLWILKNYILKTFERCYHQCKISYSTDGSSCLFNTGLMTENGNDIYGYFSKNLKPNAQNWFFNDFVSSDDRRLSNFSFNKPLLADYCDDPKDFYFDTSLPIEFASSHIFDDNIDTEETESKEQRYPQELLSLGKPVITALVRDAFETSKKKVMRNNRLVVPQFYKSKIMYLMPISIPLSTKNILMALAIERQENNTYRANTIFTIEMAYPKARLIMKPESNWLIK